MAAQFDEDEKRALSVYCSLVKDYPGTAVEIGARAGLLASLHPHRLTDRKEGAAFVQATETMLKELDAPDNRTW